jgi:hypothetical protein
LLLRVSKLAHAICSANLRLRGKGIKFLSRSCAWRMHMPRGVDWSTLFSKAFLAGSIDLEEPGQCASRATRLVGHWLTYSLGLPGATAAQEDAARFGSASTASTAPSGVFAHWDKKKTNRRGNTDVIIRVRQHRAPRSNTHHTQGKYGSSEEWSRQLAREYGVVIITVQALTRFKHTICVAMRRPSLCIWSTSPGWSKVFRWVGASTYMGP